jgi:type VI secretion system protein ImpK
MQDELFGGHEAGETFFENVNRLLAQGDSAEVADILEVYQVCMLLGYRGRYGGSTQGEMSSLLHAIRQKIQRIRGHVPDLTPGWGPPLNEKPPVMADPWLRPLVYAVAAGLLFVIVLFAAFSLSLNSGISELRSLNAQFR